MSLPRTPGETGRMDDAGMQTTPVVTSIHLAPGTRLPTRAVEQVEAEEGRGLVGDRYHGTRHRHVTVQAQPDLDAAAADLGAPVPAGSTRRNVTVSLGPVPTKPGTRMRVGDTLLEVVRLAAPCRLMDDYVAPGAMRALHARGGAVFRILESGTIRVGDVVEVLGTDA